MAAVLREIADEKSGSSESEKQGVMGAAEPEFDGLRDGAGRHNDGSGDEISDPSTHFHYGLALMDGQFWEEAICELDQAAELGYRTVECREFSGDCASRAGRWEQAIRYYHCVYSDETLPEELRKRILLKITQCSQTQKKLEVRSSAPVNDGMVPSEIAPAVRQEFVTSSISSLDKYSLNSLLGQTVTSLTDGKGAPLADSVYTYLVSDLLHVGSSSLVVELQRKDSGQKFAGQILTGRLGKILPPAKLAAWAQQMMMCDSRHLVKIVDVACREDHCFIVREHLPLSLNDIISSGLAMPIPIAIRLAYQVLEAIGDLHLQMGKDGNIRNIFHLDLRPSRILLRKDKPLLKVYNGGIWREMERCAPKETAIMKLPLPFLSYRAPEQFRPYLARKRPPVFTDIYLFGALFYEMLTGVPAFKASSREEYEIQHCEQYPSPPKVWRPEIPDQLNDMIMQCLASDPVKRWRSATQMSLFLEKAFSDAVAPPKNDSYVKYLERLKLI